KKAFTYRIRGLIRADQRRDDEAFADFGRAFELDPNFYVVLLDRAELFDRRGEIEAELADLDRVLEIQPDLADGRVARAGARVRAGDMQGSIADATRAIE